MMLRKWCLALTFAAAGVAALAVAPTAADDATKSPLQKIMVEMDTHTKAIQKVTTSLARFRRSGGGKDVGPAAEKLVELARKTRPFTEPAAKLKKPQTRWVEYTDQCVKAAGEMAKAAKTNDYQEIRKALKTLDQSCTTCHGLFRPKSGDDDF